MLISYFRWCLALLAVGTLLGDRATAQVIPDGTLGAESSQLVINGVTVDEAAADLIRAGARRGENLFHSFEQFSIGEGQRVYFENPSGVSRIFSRVTGEVRSDILGTLGSLGGADLFLLNPNGIVFGPNARLDVGGSFVASTADAFAFGEVGRFSARNPEIPTPLLTIQPSALAFSQAQAGDIVVRSQADEVGLRVPDGESLVLLGGDVTVDGGQLNAPGGRVEVGAAAGVGVVGLRVDGRLTFAEGLMRGGVTFENDSDVDVRAAGGGDIGVTARTIDVVESDLFAGIAQGLGSLESQAGDIVIDVSDRFRIFGRGAQVSNRISSDAAGNSGNVLVTTSILEILNGAQLTSGLFEAAQGNVGDVVIDASGSVRLVGERSVIGSNIDGTSAVGTAGNVEITTRTLEVFDGAQLITGVRGRGNGGDIIIDARELVRFSGGAEFEIGSPGVPSSVLIPIQSSGAYSQTGVNAVGTGGNIEINTQRLELLNGATLVSGPEGRGDGGNIVVNASEAVRLAGRSEVFGAPSIIDSAVLPGAVGDGGNIEINTQVLEVLDGAFLVSGLGGEGNAGNVIINASESVRLAGLGELSAQISDIGGDVLPSAIFSDTLPDSIGNGGTITITTPRLEALDGAIVVSGTQGAGDAGDIILNVQILEILGGARLISVTRSEGNAGDIIITASDSVRFAGQTADRVPRPDGSEDFISSGAFSNTDPETTFNDGIQDITIPASTGDGGTITITAPQLEVSGGAQLVAGTQGEGDAGDIILEIGDRLTLNDGQILAGSESATGRGGEILINAPLLTLSDGSEILADTFSTDGGDIAITLGSLLALTGNSTISAEAGTESGGGNGGNITITSPFIVSGFSEDSDIVADAFDGSGGSVSITAIGGVFGIAPRDFRTPQSDITASSENGVSGTVTLESPEVDPSQTTAELPIAFVAPDVVQSCRERFAATGSSFVISGRGGIPQGPQDPQPTLLWQDALPIEGEAEMEEGT
ncbi:MAG: filamentous hemagglutinin N-terminal domain-containing protein, partial [Elainellaceae cyanobacterium]